MGFSSLFIRRPIATSLLMAALLLFGILGYRTLPVSALPNIEAPSLQVVTQYPGASPSTMARLVTTPLERQFGEIAGLAMMSSESSQGLSVITLQFVQSRNIEDAAQDVQAGISAARGSLPANLPYPPVYNKVNPADAPILTLALTSATLPVRDVTNYADSILAQKLSQISGVGLVSVAGNVKPAVRIQVNPAALANLGLTLEDVRSAITQSNVNAPKGSLNGSEQSFSIGANDQLPDAQAYRDLIISYNKGAPVRLSDVASVIDGVENDQVAAWANDQPAVLLDIRRQPSANIVQTVAQIRAELPALRAVLPAGVTLSVFSDRTETIRASVADVEFTLLLAVILVVAVIFVFLRRLWATVIPSVAVPLSLVGTFGVMAFAGFSLDNLSLMALTVATGFVVDDAIVMIENIVRYIEQGRQPREAAEIGSKEIGFTILSLTVSLIAVFLPLLLMPGVTGRLFHEFAWVLTIAVSLSALISLTLTPMMCAYLLKPGALPAHEQPQAAARGFYARMAGAYGRSLEWVFEHRPLVMAVFAASVVVTVALYVWIPKSLLPDQDTGLITGVIEADQSIAFPAMERRVETVAAELRKDPDVAGVAAFVGIGSLNPTINQGQLSIVLKPRSSRPGLATVLARLQQSASGIPGVALFLKPVQDVTLDTRVAATQYQFVLRDLDSNELNRYATRMAAALKQLPQLTDVDSNLADRGRELKLDHRPRDGLAPRRADADHQRHPVRRLRPTPDLDHLHRAQPVPRDSRGGAAIPQQHGPARPADGAQQRQRRAHRQQRHHLRPGGIEQLVDADRHRRGQYRHRHRRRRYRAAVVTGQRAAGLGTAGGQPLRPDARGGDLVQRRRRLFAVAGGGRDQPRAAADGLSSLAARRLHRLGGRILGLADRRGAADPGRDRGDLHRARRALRELYPSADDPVDAAVCRRRRAAGADRVRHAAIGRRHHRHHPADRHRQEKRDHDGGLRDRRPARGPGAAAGDPPRRAAALPPDHDDHRRGAARRAAAGAGQWHRLGAAPTARHQHRRRPAAVAAGDALHHAGDLSVPGAVRGMAAPARHPPQRGRGTRRGMNISAPFIRRPVGTSLLAVGVLVAGLIAYSLLGVGALPNLDFPAIFVQASVPGADARNMANTVAAPLERHLGQIAGIDEMNSSSSEGSSFVIMLFDVGRNIDDTARDVQAAINAAAPDLPSSLRTAPIYRKANPNNAPVLVLALTSDTQPLSQLYNVADTTLAPRLSQISGVAQVDIAGGAKPAVRVDLNLRAMAAMGLTGDQVRNALVAANVIAPQGYLSRRPFADGHGRRRPRCRPPRSSPTP